MKIYFACSVRGGREDKDMYLQIVEFLRSQGEVLTEFNVDKDLTPLGTPGATSKTYARDMKMLMQADVVIAEVSTPSLGVGYEIGKGEEMKLPVLALYHPRPDKSLSAMIDGNPYITVAEYRDFEESASAIKEFLAQLSQPYSA